MNVRDICQRIIEMVWPPECRHCGRVEPGRVWFCTHCFDGFEIIGRRTRKIGVFDAVCSTYGREGAPLTFYQRMKKVDSKRQAKIMAALMVVKYLKLDWPLPSKILPGGRSDIRVARAFAEMLPTGEGEGVLVVGLDQDHFMRRGALAMQLRPEPLLGISFLDSPDPLAHY